MGHIHTWRPGKCGQKKKNNLSETDSALVKVNKMMNQFSYGIISTGSKTNRPLSLAGTSQK
jgi:hypothetical protein